VKELSF